MNESTADDERHKHIYTQCLFVPDYRHFSKTSLNETFIGNITTHFCSPIDPWIILILLGEKSASRIQIVEMVERDIAFFICFYYASIGEILITSSSQMPIIC